MLNPMFFRWGDGARAKAAGGFRGAAADGEAADAITAPAGQYVIRIG